MFKTENWFAIDRDRGLMRPKIGKIVSTALLVLLTLILLFGTIGTVPSGNTGIRTLGSAVEGTVNPGFYLKLPFIQHVIVMNTQTQKESVESVEAASKDLQTVKTNVAINYHIGADKAIQIFTNIGTDYTSKIIDPAIQETVKASTAKYTAEELITNREQAREDIITLLTTKLALFGISTDAVNITNFDFSPQFNQAIEKKVTAEQNALAAKNQLEQTKYEAEQRVAQAKGEAEAIRIQSQAIESGGGKNYVALQWIEAWSKGGSQVPNMIVGTGGSTNFLLDVGNLGSK